MLSFFKKLWNSWCGEDCRPEWLHNVSKDISYDEATVYLRALKAAEKELGCSCIIIIPRLNGHRYFSKLPQRMVEATIIDAAIAFKKDTN